MTQEWIVAGKRIPFFRSDPGKGIDDLDRHRQVAPSGNCPVSLISCCVILGSNSETWRMIFRTW